MNYITLEFGSIYSFYTVYMIFTLISDITNTWNVTDVLNNKKQLRTTIKTKDEVGGFCKGYFDCCQRCKPKHYSGANFVM